MSRKPRPESGLDCLVCAKFAGQRPNSSGGTCVCAGFIVQGLSIRESESYKIHCSRIGDSGIWIIQGAGSKDDRLGILFRPTIHAFNLEPPRTPNCQGRRKHKKTVWPKGPHFSRPKGPRGKAGDARNKPQGHLLTHAYLSTPFTRLCPCSGAVYSPASLG